MLDRMEENVRIKNYTLPVVLYGSVTPRIDDVSEKGTANKFVNQEEESEKDLKQIS
jgi:hypothetical protein